jgi:(1->4)-alpha-D-glucan 1-alpha-D-glucosylmutase
MAAAAPRHEPTATYRLQLRQRVTLADARRAVPYLEALGVSHLYLSPPFAATEGSTHGYDVVDPNRIDPALGTEDDLLALAEDLDARGMGLLVDIVPNHMAASPQNPMWRDLLARGTRSPSARTFDVDLAAVGGKTLLPVLTATLDDELADGAFEVALEGEVAELRYRGFGLPLSPETERSVRDAGVDAINADRERLRGVIERQRYALSPWQDEENRRNYRRFFDITDLVGVRQEDARVFRATHELVTRWVRDGVVDGLRVDHVDGLRDPLGYLERLRERVDPPWLLVEKILAPDEALPSSWPVDGTTGYEATIDLNDLFVERRGWERLGRFTTSFRGGASAGFEDIRDVSRRLVLEVSFAAEVSNLARDLERFARMTTTRPPSFDDLRDALVETTAEMDVYRTYVRDGLVSGEDRRRIRRALSGAGARLGPSRRAALAVVRRALLVEIDDDDARALASDIVARWQQLTGPAAAKGEEDTALYRDARLLSRNEVGADPGLPPHAANEIHRRFATRGRRWPRSLVATSTHDTKRGEDTRMRIDVLSELAQGWCEAAERWSEMNAPLRLRAGDREAPSPAEELMLYQTMLGTWPVHGQSARGLNDRLRAFLEKALREAKVNSSWLAPDEAYERAVFAFAKAVIGKRNAAFLDDFTPFAQRVAFHGALNSLSQVVLKCVVPGIPDIYQGSDGWNLSLVDPDNRTPPNLDGDARALAGADRVDDPVELLERWPTGDVKRSVTSRALRFRREHPALFSEGARYLPIAATGRHAERVIAAARRGGRTWVLAVVPRFTTRVVNAGSWPVGRDVWGPTALALPSGAPGRWRDVFTGDEIVSRAGRFDVASVLTRFPVALLTNA